MKTANRIMILLLSFLINISSIEAVEVAESKLKISSGKMLYVLVKTEWEMTAKMSGIAEEFSGIIDVQAKTVNISVSIKHQNFYLTGAYKFANDLMHEGFLESDKYPNANFQGSIVSQDIATGEIKVKGKMTIHGISKENVEIAGKLKKEANGYLFTSTFKINPKDYKMEPPKIKEVDVSIKFELASN